MSRITTPVDSSFEPLMEQVQGIIEFVQEAARTGQAAHEVERGLWKWLLQLGYLLLGLFFRLHGTGDEGERLVLPTGRAIKRLTARPRPYQSVFGRYELVRVVYGQREGQRIETIPFDARLQLPQESTSYLLQEWNELLMLEMPYTQAQQTLERMLGIRQSVHTLERNQATLSKTVEAFWAQRPSPLPEDEGTLLVNSVDCKGVCMRASETDGETGKKKMAILGSVYSIEPHVRTPEAVLEALFEGPLPQLGDPGPPRPKPVHKHVRACLKRDDAGTTAPQTAEVFDWMAQENAQRNPHQDKPTVVLIDGQDSLWTAAWSAIPGEDVTEILDIIHVSGYVWDAANLLYPQGSSEARRWAKGQLGRVLQGQVGAVVRDLKDLAKTGRFTAPQRKTLDSICTYFANNSHRMAYDAYLAEGFPIATGVIEGACRCLVKDRMERSGMRWIVRGAQAMLALRSISFSGLWDDFMPFHIRREINRLYGAEAANEEMVPMPLVA